MPRDHTDILPGLAESEYPEMAARIMAVALELFANKGYAATSVRDIVRRAEVTNPTLYYYFENKADLFNELVCYLFESMADSVDRALSESEGLVEQLRAIAWAHLDASRHSPQALKFIYSVLFGPSEMYPDFDLTERHAERMARVASLFEEAIAAEELTPHEDFDALFLAQQLFGLLNSHLMRTLKVVEHLECDEVRQAFLMEAFSQHESDKLIDFFLRGAGAVSSRES